MDLSPETLNKRFAELSKKRDAILAKSTPVRETRDALVAKHNEKREAHDEELMKAEKGLYEIDQERAMIARALGTKLEAL